MKKTLVLVLFYFVATCCILLAGERFDIPALCYHQVEPKASGRFSLSIRKFTEQLAYIKKHGYSSINSDQLLEIIKSGKPFPSKKVLISFDDGYKTVYKYAFPIMKKFGFVGVACIYPKFIGGGSAMTWNQIKELAANGWSIECHSFSHANLAKHYGNPDLYRKFLHKEIVESRNIIKKHTGILPKLMVWPYGVYTDTALNVTKEEGYSGALTVDGGANYQGIDPYYIKRQVIYDNDSKTKFLIRFGMGGLKLTNQFPKPGQVLNKLATFSFKIPDIKNYSSKLYKLNVRLSHSRTKFTYNAETKTVNGSVLSNLRPGSYFLDVYLRDEKTGVTSQNGWLFTIKKGKAGKTKTCQKP